MKKVFLLLSFLSATAFGQEITFVRDSIITQYVKNGLASTNFIPKGEKDANDHRQGKWYDYATINDVVFVSEPNGNPKQIKGTFLLYGEGSYVDGRKEGPWKYYTIEDGTFKKIVHQDLNFLNGKLNGTFKYYFPSGAIASEGIYLEGVLEGEAKSYYESGVLHDVRLYRYGSKMGRNAYFYPNGSIEMEQYFDNGIEDGPYQAYYSNGNLKEKFQYVRGKVNGKYLFFYENGQIWVEEDYRNGLLYNVNGNYDKEGNARRIGTLHNGTGTVNYYDSEGKIYMTKTFKEGVDVSPK